MIRFDFSLYVEVYCLFNFDSLFSFLFTVVLCSSPNSLVGMCCFLISFIPVFNSLLLRCLLTTAHAWAGTGTSGVSTGPSGPRTWSGQLRFIRVLYVQVDTSPNFGPKDEMPCGR